VPDASVNLDWTGWVYSGGVSAGDVLLNMPSALDLNLTSANKVNILAPYADAYFPSGMITGSLVVGDLQGGGQINVGHFDHAPAVPEPATLSLLAIGALIIRTRKQ